MKIHTIYLLAVTIITSCTLNMGQDAGYQYIDYHKYTEEYINRVGKRLLIVNKDNNIASAITFKLNNSKDAKLITIDNKIIISKGMLYYLQDEAELASVLAISLVRWQQVAFGKGNNNPDEEIINYLYLAGYDPRALIDLQQEFLLYKSKKHNWLKDLFLYRVSKVTVNISNNLALDLAKGTSRFKQRYLNHIRLLKTLD